MTEDRTWKSWMKDLGPLILMGPVWLVCIVATTTGLYPKPADDVFTTSNLPNTLLWWLCAAVALTGSAWLVLLGIYYLCSYVKRTVQRQRQRRAHREQQRTISP